MATKLCIEVPDIPKYSITLPGMGELQYIRDTLEQIPRPSTFLLKFLNSIAIALAPFQAILHIVNVIQAIIKCIQAIPKSILTLSPTPILRCFSALFEVLAKILPLLPPLAYARMIYDILEIVLYLMNDLIDVLKKIDLEMLTIRALIQQAVNENDAQLLQIGNCAKQNLESSINGLLQVFELLGAFLGIITAFLDLLADLLPPSMGKEIEALRAKMISGPAEFGADGFPLLSPMYTFITDLQVPLIALQRFVGLFLGLPLRAQVIQSTLLNNP